MDIRYRGVNGDYELSAGDETEESREQNNEEYNNKTKLTIEEVYKITNGRIGYKKAKLIIEFLRGLSESRIKAIRHERVIRELLNGKISKEDEDNLIKMMKDNCFVLNSSIINRENNKGLEIAGSVNVGLDRQSRILVSDKEQKKIIQALLDLDETQLEDILNLDDEMQIQSGLLFDIISQGKEISENEFYASAIIDNIDFSKIYKELSEEKRIMSKHEREILISELKKADCKRLYNAFLSIGVQENEITGYIVNLLINNGYKGYTLDKLSRLDNLEEILKINIQNGFLKNRIMAIGMDNLLGIKDNSNRVNDSNFGLRDFQQDIKDNIDDIYEDKRTAIMVLSTGGGKSFITMAEMLDFKNPDSNEKSCNSNILFLASQHAILDQFAKHIVKHVLGYKVITEKEYTKLKEEGKPIPKNAVIPKNIMNVVRTKFPNLKMYCYDTIANRDDEWLKSLDLDFIIADEMHRAGAKTYGPKVKRLLELNPKAKVLAMTATYMRDREGADVFESKDEGANLVDGMKIDNRNMADVFALMSGDYTLEEIAKRKQFACDIDVFEAIQEGYVVSPKIVGFDYFLQESDEYAEVKKMISEELSKENPDFDKVKELKKIKEDIDKLIPSSKKEGINDVFTNNIQKKDGKYIIFLPRKDKEYNHLTTEEYIKLKMAEVEEYFRDVNSDIESYYLLSTRKDGKKQNENAIAEFDRLDDEDSETITQFENAEGGKIKLLFAIDMLNEGVHVEGVNGIVMMRPIGEDSKILYRQQIGRCIWAEDPKNPTMEEDRPVIFDMYNNYLSQNMNAEANKINQQSDLQRIESARSWINRHKRFPDINSEDTIEAHKAVNLKNIQRRYRKYVNACKDIELNNTYEIIKKMNRNLSESEIYEIQQIIQIGKEIELWNMEIPERIIPPSEKEITRNEVFKVKGTQREFLDLFKKAQDLTKDRRLSSNLRISQILTLLELLSEEEIEISNKTIGDDTSFKDFVEKLPKDVKNNVLYKIQNDPKLNIDSNFNLGEEYNFAKRSFYDGNKYFLNYDVQTLRKCGIFEDFIIKEQEDNKRLESSINSNEFIIKGPKKFYGINIRTGTLYDEEWHDINGLDLYGLRKGEDFTEYRFNKNNKHYYEIVKRRLVDTGRIENDYGFRIDGINIETGELEDINGFKIDKTWRNSGKAFDPDGYNIAGVDKFHFGRNGNYYENIVSETQILIYGKYTTITDEKWIDTGKKLNPQNLDKNGDYWEVDENQNPIRNTHQKFGEDGFSLYGINRRGFSKYDMLWYDVDVETGKPIRQKGRKLDEEGLGFYGIKETGFDIDGYYWIKKGGSNSEGNWEWTGKRINPQNLDANGDCWIVDKNGNPIKMREGELKKFGKDGYSLYGISSIGFSKKDGLWYGVDLETGKKLYEEPRVDPYGFTVSEKIRSKPFIRFLKKHFVIEGFERDGINKWTRDFLTEEGFDINGDYWETETDEYGKRIPIKNTHQKFDLDGFSIHRLNKYGFSTNGLYYGIDFKTGRMINSRGRELDPEEFNAEGIKCNQFGRNGNYYVLKDGEWLDTGKKLNPQNFDINGDLWRVDENGNPIENLHQKFGEDGFSLYLIDRRGFNKKDKLWYGVNLKTGKPIKENGSLKDPNGQNFYGLFEANFDNNGYYWEQDENGKWQNTGRKINPQHLDANSDRWEVDENGDPIKNTHQKIGTDGYSLYGINKYGFSKYDKLYYGLNVRDGKPILEEGSQKDQEGFDFYNLNEFNFDRDGYFYKINNGKLYNTGKKINDEQLDVHGNFWLIDEQGNPIENTYSKFGKDGYSLYGINFYGFSYDGLYYGVNRTDGKPRSQYGKKRDPDGFDAYGIDEEGKTREERTYIDIENKIDFYGFNANGIYCVQAEDGTWNETGLIYNPNGFKVEITNTYNGGEYRVYKHRITNSLVNLRKFNVKGFNEDTKSIYDKNGFKQDGTYMETGEMYHNGYNAYGLDVDGKNKRGNTPACIKFAREYIKWCMNPNSAKPNLKMFFGNKNTTEEIELIMAVEIYPEIKKVVIARIKTNMMMIRQKESKLRQLLQNKVANQAEIKRVQAEIDEYKKRNEDLEDIFK